MDLNRPKKLNLDAPFLSTRRTNVVLPSLEILPSNSQGPDTNRVPFSWEQCPGKPKDTENNISDDIIDVQLLRPKPPPGRFPPPREPSECHNTVPRNQDEGCDGDVEDEYDSFSEEIDMFSLSQAIDFVEPVNYFRGGNFDEPSGVQSPSFIIQRFLQDAKALAVASSALSVPKDTKYTDKCGAYASSPKGCGLELLLPWRMKHKPCAVKSPVKEMPLRLKPKLGMRERQSNSLEESSWKRGGAID